MKITNYIRNALVASSILCGNSMDVLSQPTSSIDTSMPTTEKVTKNSSKNILHTIDTGVIDKAIDEYKNSELGQDVIQFYGYRPFLEDINYRKNHEAIGNDFVGKIDKICDEIRKFPDEYTHSSDTLGSVDFTKIYGLVWNIMGDSVGKEKKEEISSMIIERIQNGERLDGEFINNLYHEGMEKQCDKIGENIVDGKIHRISEKMANIIRTNPYSIGYFKNDTVFVVEDDKFNRVAQNLINNEFKDYLKSKKESHRKYFWASLIGILSLFFGALIFVIVKDLTKD